MISSLDEAVGEILSELKIANHLNSNMIPTKLNKKWGPETVSKILKNPLYCGYLHWEDYINPGDHEPIINKNLFNKVQQLIKSKKNKKNTNSKFFIIEN